MSRSIWKGPYCATSVINAFASDTKEILIYSRSSTILPEFVGRVVHIYNGKEFKKLKISPEHVGFKFGEFSPTKKPAKFKKK